MQIKVALQHSHLIPIWLNKYLNYHFMIAASHIFHQLSFETNSLITKISDQLCFSGLLTFEIVVVLQTRVVGLVHLWHDRTGRFRGTGCHQGRFHPLWGGQSRTQDLALQTSYFVCNTKNTQRIKLQLHIDKTSVSKYMTVPLFLISEQKYKRIYIHISYFFWRTLQRALNTEINYWDFRKSHQFKVYVLTSKFM